MEFSCQNCQKASKKVDLEPITWCLSCIRVDPITWGKTNLDAIKKSRCRYDGLAYLITFTCNPNSRYTKGQWLERVVKELRRTPLSNVKATLEHVDSNIHCHALVTSTKALYKKLFKVFNDRYGYVDLRRISVDNGTQEYIEKDLPSQQHAMTPDQLLETYFHKLN